MFFIYLFVLSAGVLGILFYVWHRELTRGERYFESIRARADVHVARLQTWLEENVTPEKLLQHGQHMATYITHHGARLMARFAHMLEYRARTVVHRTARRVRKQAHYLEDVKDEALDRSTKKGNNTASEQ